MTKIGLLAIVAATCCGCMDHLHFDGPQVQGSGKLKKETRKVAAFDRLELGGAIEAVVTVGPAPFLQIEADDNILPLLHTKVVNGTLDVGTTRSFNTNNRIKLWIKVPNLSAVEVNGASKADVSRLKSSSFTADLNGASSVKAVGTVDELTLDLSGASNADLSGLRAKRVVADLNGASSAKVWASESLNGEANGASRLVYSGEPGKTAVEAVGASSIEQSSKSAE